MLFDPYSMMRNPWPFVATLFVILIGKSVAAFLIVIVFRHPATTALTISVSLAQIGEFSFILADLGVTSNLLPKEGRDLILAGAIFSIMLNPLLFAVLDWLTPRLEQRRAPSSVSVVPEPIAATELTDHTILVGYGRVGAIVGHALKEKELPFLAIEAADGLLAKLKRKRIETIIGNAAKPDVLQAANPSSARCLVIAIPEAFEAGQIVQQARVANPEIRIVARAHSDAEVDHLQGLGADVVIMGEREIARGMIAELERRYPDADEQPKRVAAGAQV
jgi:CPA2 family monovalent cation:H+ antiporter-2